MDAASEVPPTVYGYMFADTGCPASHAVLDPLDRLAHLVMVGGPCRLEVEDLGPACRPLADRDQLLQALEELVAFGAQVADVQPVVPGDDFAQRDQSSVVA